MFVPIRLEPDDYVRVYVWPFAETSTASTRCIVCYVLATLGSHRPGEISWYTYIYIYTREISTIYSSVFFSPGFIVVIIFSISHERVRRTRHKAAWRYVGRAHVIGRFSSVSLQKTSRVVVCPYAETGWFVGPTLAHV